CLAKKPSDRYPTAQEFTEDLRRFRSSSAKPKGTARTRLLPVVLAAEATGKEMRLSKPITLVGRAVECTLVLRVPDVSTHHAQITLDTEQAVVEDLGSANGTFLNGRRVRKARLRDGDKLQFADHVFQVRIEDEE